MKILKILLSYSYLQIIYEYSGLYEIILDKLIKSDHMCGIILSTIFNHNSKKSNIKGHGYFLGIIINLINAILK